ncbi:MAG: hypothetical protein ACOYNP_09880 [Gemmataceae bacterium]|jgi:hypothetical protein|nr:SH3 domain-containing protein [Planctomycetota bacterium]
MIIVTACLLALWLPDQTAVRYTATIAVPEAELRAGPSNDTKLYTTNKLRQGDTVVVVEERPDGWLAVRPPSGSFSWINARYLQQVTPTLPNWVVNAPAGTKVTVLVGSSSDTTVRPSVESASLQRGAQVRAIGTVVGNDDQKWLPVEPPESERRYMRREAIGTATVAHAPSPAAPAAVAAMTVGGSGALISNNPTARWNEAVSTELSGNWTEAIRLYSLIAQDFGDSQPNMATQAANRAMALREGLRNPGMRISPPERPCLSVLPAPTGNNIQLAQPVMPASTLVPGQLMSSSGSSSGILRRSGRSVDDRRAYILERDNRIIGYVVPVPTLNLEPFLNQPVILIGTTEYRGEVRANVVHASTVTLGR